MSEMEFKNAYAPSADSALREQIMDRFFMMGTMKQTNSIQYESMVHSILKGIHFKR